MGFFRGMLGVVDDQEDDQYKEDDDTNDDAGDCSAGQLGVDIVDGRHCLGLLVQVW